MNMAISHTQKWHLVLFDQQLKLPTIFSLQLYKTRKAAQSDSDLYKMFLD